MPRSFCLFPIVAAFSLLISLTVPLPVAATDLGEVIVAGGSLKTDKAAQRRLLNIVSGIRKKKGIILEIEGEVRDPDRSKSVEKSYALAKEASMLIESKITSRHFDIYLSSAPSSAAVDHPVPPRIRLFLHDDRFRKIPLGIMTTPADPPTPLVNTRQPAVNAPKASTVPLESSKGDRSLQIPERPPLSPAALKELDDRITKEQAVRAQSLIERAKAKAAERERKRALEEKREAELRQRTKQEGEDQPEFPGTSRPAR